MRRLVLLVGVVPACDRGDAPAADVAPVGVPTETPTPTSPSPDPVPTAPVVAPAVVVAEPQPHGFALVRPGGKLLPRADGTLPAVTLPDGGRGFTMAVVGRQGDLIALESKVDDTHCGSPIGALSDLRMRWHVAPADLVDVTTARTTVEYDDGTRTELLAGVPLRRDGDGWIASADGVEIWVRLAADKVGRYYDLGDRAFADTPTEPLAAGEEPLLYDRTRAVDEAGLVSMYLGKRVVSTFAREDKGGRVLAEVRSPCAAIRVVVPASRTRDVSTELEAARFAEGLVGGMIGGSYLGGSPAPTWYVDRGTTAYWRDGSVGGLVEAEHTFAEAPREVDGRSCFAMSLTAAAESRFDLCFVPTDVRETVGTSVDAPPGSDLGAIGLGLDLGLRAEGGLGAGEVGGAELGGGGLGTLGGGGSPGGSLGGSSTKVPRIRQGVATVSGTYDKDLVRRIVRAHISEVRTCYEKALAKDATLGGTVTIGFTIGPTGSVTASSVKDDTLADPGVGTCVVKRVKAWKFPTPAGGGLVVVRYPFVFSAG